MEEPVFIKCEPAYILDTAELNNADCDVKLTTEKQTEVKTEPEDVISKPFIKEEVEIQDVKIEAYDKNDDAWGVSLNEIQILSAQPKVSQTTFTYDRNIGKSLKQCNICGRRLSCDRVLKEHLLLHTGRRPHKCNECGKTYAQLSSLRSHLVLHSGDKSHTCSICGSNFKVRSSLNFHVLCHSTEKPYACLHCGMRFTVKQYLDRHMIVHTDVPAVNPCKCNTCGKTFSQSGALLKHYCMPTR